MFPSADLLGWLKEVSHVDTPTQRSMLWDWTVKNDYKGPFYDIKLKVPRWPNEEETEFGVHKLVLAMGSPVFSELILQLLGQDHGDNNTWSTGRDRRGRDQAAGTTNPVEHFEQTLVLEIKDLSPSTVRYVLQFLYTETVGHTQTDLSWLNVGGLLYAARKYEIPKLKEHMLDFLKNLKYELALQSFVDIPHLKEIGEASADGINCYKEILKYFTSYILKNGETALRLKKFKSFCIYQVNEILQSDFLNADEFTIYKALTKWAESQCRLKGLNPEDFKHIGEVLRTPDEDKNGLGALRFVRFPRMDSTTFTLKVNKCGGCLLPDNIVEEVYKYYTVKEATDMFSIRPRKCNFDDEAEFEEHIETIANKLVKCQCIYKDNRQSESEHLSDYTESNSAAQEGMEGKWAPTSTTQVTGEESQVNRNNAIIKSELNDYEDTFKEAENEIRTYKHLPKTELEDCIKAMRPARIAAYKLRLWKSEEQTVWEQEQQVQESLIKVGTKIKEFCTAQKDNCKDINIINQLRGCMWKFAVKCASLNLHPRVLKEAYTEIVRNAKQRTPQKLEKTLVQHEPSANCYEDAKSSNAQRETHSLDFVESAKKQMSRTQDLPRHIKETENLTQSKIFDSISTSVRKSEQNEDPPHGVKSRNRRKLKESNRLESLKRLKLECESDAKSNALMMDVYKDNFQSNAFGSKNEICIRDKTIKFNEIMTVCLRNPWVSRIIVEGTMTAFHKKFLSKEPIQLPNLVKFLMKCEAPVKSLIKILKSINLAHYVHFYNSNAKIDMRLSDLWRHSVNVSLVFGGITIFALNPTNNEFTINYTKNSELFNLNTLTMNNLLSLTLANCSINHSKQWLQTGTAECIKELRLYSVKGLKFNEILNQCVSLETLVIWATELETPTLILADISSNKLQKLVINNYMLKVNPKSSRTLTFLSVKQVSLLNCSWDDSLIDLFPHIFPNLETIFVRSFDSKFFPPGPKFIESIRKITTVERITVWNFDLNSLENPEFHDLKNFLKGLGIKKNNACHFQICREVNGSWIGANIAFDKKFEDVYNIFEFKKLLSFSSWPIVRQEYGMIAL